MSLQRRQSVEFGPFRLQPAERALHRAGEPVSLPPKAFDLLVALVARAGRLVTKEELLEAVWPGTFVEEANLSYNVSLIRKALANGDLDHGDGPDPQRYIETVQKHGYRFVAAVRPVDDDARPDEGEGQAAGQGAGRGEGRAEGRGEENGGRGSNADLAAGGAPSPSPEQEELVSAASEDRLPDVRASRARRSALLLAAAFVAALGAIGLVLVQRWAGRGSVPDTAISGSGTGVGAGAGVGSGSGSGSVSGASPEPGIVPVTSFAGAESQPAFSADGSRIAFVWDGEREDNADIYVKLVDTGEPLRLTSNPATESNPVWSPDGRHVAFVREVDQGDGGQPDASSSSSSSSGGIYLVPALGGPERKLADAFPYRPLNKQTLDFSPDGRFLAIADKSNSAAPFSIVLLALDTLQRRTLTFPPTDSLGDDTPAFSPDGTALAFARNRGGGVQDLYVVPLAGGEPRRLTFDDATTFGMAWSLDGRDIIFSSWRRGVPQLWRVPAAGGASPERVPALGHNLMHPAISRGTERLAYTQSTEDTNIWRVPLDRPKSAASAAAAPVASPPARFISSTLPDISPQYSPDGSRVVFVSWRSGSSEVWLADRDSANAIQLTSLQHGNTGTPRWSPDGRQVAFDSLVEGNRDLYVVGIEGGTPRRLTSEPAEDMCPSWSRDGRWIYFGSNRGGSLQIWKQPVDGGAAVQVTTQGGFEGFESFDGAWFYYARGRGVPGIWRVPVSGGGTEAPVLADRQAGLWRSWTVTADGLYVVTAEQPAQPVLLFFSFATRRVSEIATLDEPIPRHAAGISVSPDGRSLLYTQIDERGSDIMLASHSLR